jgi:hypothetical protein
MAYNLRGNRIDYKRYSKGIKHKGIPDVNVLINKDTSRSMSNADILESELEVNSDSDIVTHVVVEKDNIMEERQKAVEDKKLQLQAAELEAEELDLEEKLMKAQESLVARREALAARRAALTAATSLNKEPNRPTDTQRSPPQLPEENSQPRGPTGVTTATLARDKDLAACLDVLKSTNGNFLDEILGSSKAPQHEEHANSRVGVLAGKSPLYIPDYVLNPTASSRVSEQHLGRGLVLRDSRSRIKTEDITAEQWAGANARILIELMENMEWEQVIDYLRYTAQIADLMQVCKRSSVMLLDESHRTRIHTQGGRWDQIDQMKAYVFLNKKEEEQKPTNKRQWGYNRESARGPKDNSGRPICLQYNTEAGCQRTPCRFVHMCSTPGCHDAHPRFKHQEYNVPPRFRPSRE